MVYTTAFLSLQLNSAQEVTSKPDVFSFKDTNRRSQQAYMCANTCTIAAKVFSKPLSARLALLSPRQDIQRKVSDTSPPSQRVAVMHHQMHNHSSVFHCFFLQGVTASVLLSTSVQV